MNKIKFSHLLFGLALITALALSVLPAAPVHALSSSAGNAGMAAGPVGAAVLSTEGGVVCRSVVLWRNGHRTVVRRCHRVTNPPS